LRRIYQQPGSPPLSLGSVEANDWVGWASVVRGEPDLTLIASQITVLLLVPFSDAIEALRADQSLQQALAMPLFEETAVLLLQELERKGRAVAEPRQLIEELFGHWSLADPAADPSHGAIELLSGPRPASAMAIGAFLDQKSRIDLPLHVNQLPIRIVSLPEEELSQALGDVNQTDKNSTNRNSNALALRPEQLPVLLERSGAEAAENYGFHRPEGEATAFATGATSRLEQALACISHLAASKQLAYSAELVKRNLEDVEQRLGALKLAQLGLQLEAMGFDTRPMRARPWDLTRLEPPALIDLDGAFVMLLVAAGGSGVLIGDPRVGLQRWSVKQLEERLPSGVELLVIREGRAGRVQEEAFGLGWFLPAFLRYPGLLSMTLITAFISQLLSAVFPLGVLAVIDQVIGRNNLSLLAPLTAVLVVAAIAAGITSAMRALVSADLSDRVDVRLGSTVVEHLMRLPLPYFEQR
ncbi:ABC transporter transmembrane domain-containing protein, partial [Synechococcus lacustris]